MSLILTVTGLQEGLAAIIPDGKVVGRISVRNSTGTFTYRLEWTGEEANVLELGWIFQPPAGSDRFSWDREARWTVYPEGHTSRPTGTAAPDSMNVDYTRMDRSDAFDFNATKYDCNWASLTAADGVGLRVEFDPAQRFHCRAGRTDDVHVLFVNQQVSPPTDISRAVVSDFYLTLTAGDVVEGKFRVGSDRSTSNP